MNEGTARRPDPEVLLANAGWVRALALSLVRDEAGADDVAQDTLTTAWERPPRAHVPLAPWLARVARNFAFRSLRSRKRRALREAARTPPAVAPSVEESAIRTEMFHQVVGAVLKLEPLYRDVVVLRFFEGLETVEVAERLRVPLETARTRLKRALALLRTSLDFKHGGRQAWALALVPLADAAQTAASASTGVGTTTGGLLMAASGKTIAGIGLAGALAGAALTLGTTALLDGDPSPDRRAPSASARELASGRATAEGANSAASSPRLEAGRDGALTNAPGASQTLADLIRSVEIDPPVPGKGTITGFVRTREGQPLAGAVVQAWTRMPEGPWKPGPPPAPSTLEETVRRSIRGAKWDAATRREARTNGDGAYVLEALSEVPYYVSAWLEGHQVGWAPGSRGGTYLPGTTADFVATPFQAQSLRVLLPDGTLATEAYVRWQGARGSGGGGGTWTRSQPLIYAEPGAWEMTATSGQDLSSEPINVEVGPGAPEATLRLVLRNALAGRVRLDPADAAWTILWVWASPKDPASPGGRIRGNARAPDWSFRLEGLGTGDYELSVGLNDYEALSTTTVRMIGGTVLSQVTLPRATAAHALEVRVVGPDGAPLPDADVSFGIYERRGGGTSGSGARHTRRADGTFLVALMTPSLANLQNYRERFPEGRGGGGRGGAGGGTPPEPRVEEGPATFYVKVTYKGQSKDVEYVPGSTSRVEVRFD